MLDEQRVQRDPVPNVDRLPQGRLGLLGALRPHDPEAVRDPVDVRVDGDRGDPVPEDEHAVRRLRSDAAESGEGRVVPGRDPAELVPDRARDLPDYLRLRPVEPRRPDETLHLGGRRAREGVRVGVPGEQGRARAVGVRVLRPLREDRPDQDLERVLGVVAQVRPAPVAGPIELRQPVEDKLPVERRPGGHRPSGGAAGDPGAGRSCPGSERSGSSAVSGPRISSPTR